MTYKNNEDEREYQRQHYLRNKELYKQRAKASRKAQIERNTKFLKDYLLTHPCVDCGISDVRVLQFDHRDPEDKTSSPGQLRASRGLLEKELAKCDIRCANCHMIRTAQQFGWERLWNLPA